MADVFTDAGEAQVVDLYDSNAGADFIGWGTGSTGAAKGDTDLVTPATEARVAATRTQPAADTLQWQGTITADGAKTIAEAGVFDAAGSGSPPSGGTPMILRSNFTGIAVQLNWQIEFTFTLQFT